MSERYRLFFYIRHVKRRVDNRVFGHHAIFHKSDNTLASNHEFLSKRDAEIAANNMTAAMETELEKVILGEK